MSQSYGQWTLSVPPQPRTPGIYGHLGGCFILGLVVLWIDSLNVFWFVALGTFCSLFTYSYDDNDDDHDDNDDDNDYDDDDDDDDDDDERDADQKPHVTPPCPLFFWPSALAPITSPAT